MPSGIPVATVGVNAADNAGILAVQMLSLSDESLAQQLRDYKRSMAEAVLVKDANLQMEVAKL
jgi:5-(carboxyamino)imidazole ribonucleotide mutase